MIILSVRTDKPEAEIGLFNNDTQLAYETWTAHRQLSETLLKKIETLLNSQNKHWSDIQGLVYFQGPGSFTGLRIGASVANALVASLAVPIVATGSEQWLKEGMKRLLRQENDNLALPNYGREAHITQPKH